MQIGSPDTGRRMSLLAVASALLVVGSPALPAESARPRPAPAVAASDTPFTEQFYLNECTFSSRGRNPYFILEPGYRLVLEGVDDGEEVELVITVLNETKTVNGVQTRVVEERETKDEELVEISRNFYAICAPHNSIIYFGEEVDIYEDGKVVSHDGQWLAGKNGAKAGVMMPGLNLIGARYYQEVAPGVALDRAETVSLSEQVSTPAKTFSNVLKVQETTPLEPDAVGYKYYARGVGLIQDGVLKLECSGFKCEGS